MGTSCILEMFIIDKDFFFIWSQSLLLNLRQLDSSKSFLPQVFLGQIQLFLNLVCKDTNAVSSCLVSTTLFYVIFLLFSLEMVLCGSQIHVKPSLGSVCARTTCPNPIFVSIWFNMALFSFFLFQLIPWYLREFFLFYFLSLNFKINIRFLCFKVEIIFSPLSPIYQQEKCYFFGLLICAH